jgi:uncharacterized iron-regulated membrane protein
MFKTVRTLTLTLHRWISLIVSVLVILTAGSGAILVFENEIDRALNPALSYVTPRGNPVPLSTITASVSQAYPKLRVLNMYLPTDPTFSLTALLSDGTRVSIDPYTGTILGARHITDSLMSKTHQFHTRLLVPNTVSRPAPGQPPRPSRLGNQIVGWGTVVLLFLTLTGLFVWFPRMKLTVARKARWTRINMDLHNVTGIYAVVFAIIMAATGIVIGFEYPGTVVRKATSMPPAPPPVIVRSEKGRPVISPDQAVEAAAASVPGAVASFVIPPMPPTFTYVVSMRYPEDATPAGRTKVVINPYTADVLIRETSRDLPVGTRFMNAMRPWHTGDIYGWPSRIVMFLASVAIVAQAITGFIAWWVRTFKRKEPRAAAVV